MTANISGIVALRGAKVLVIDLDPEACSTNTLLPDEVDDRELNTILETEF